MELIKKLGERIRIIRKEKGLSQDQLGELADLHTNHIGAIERGEKNVTIESIIKVSKGLNITLEELFRYIDPKKFDDDFDKIVGMLSQRTSVDHTLVLQVIDSIFKWEEKKH
jgi:XRE family transcriptional regulator, regulator of sulfur utilization